jgi:Rrf2 family protein
VLAVISKTAEYAVRACLWLGGHSGQAWTVQHVADELHVPAGYLAKVLKQLARAAIVRAQPGPGGGFLLAHSPDRICVLDVIQAVDPLPRIRECPAGLTEHEHGLCPLHSRLDAARASIERLLRGCTLAELLSESVEKV